jgi:hypothetical protein
MAEQSLIGARMRYKASLTAKHLERLFRSSLEQNQRAPLEI